MLDLIESYREMCNGLMEIYLLQASNRMSEVMKTMAVITVFFMPLTFLAGVYGMNFDRDAGNMPELGWKYGYVFFWVRGRRHRRRPVSLAEAQALDLTHIDINRIFGSELSPYSVKVRSYFRYKGIAARMAAALARDPGRVPEVRQAAAGAAGGDAGWRGHPGFDADHRAVRGDAPGPRSPDDPALAFISALLEEYGDEWGNKWMFHYRWTYVPDSWATAERIAVQMMGAQGTLAVAQARAAVAERMTGRLGFVGSNADDAAADRGVVQARAGDPRRASRVAAVPAGRPAGDGRLRPVGPALRGGDRSRRRAR